MPKLTISATGHGKIEGRVGRKALVLYLKSGDARWGFESVVETSGPSEGIPLPDQQIVSLAGDSPNSFAGPLNFASTAGAEILYTEGV